MANRADASAQPNLSRARLTARKTPDPGEADVAPSHGVNDLVSSTSPSVAGSLHESVTSPNPVSPLATSDPAMTTIATSRAVASSAPALDRPYLRVIDCPLTGTRLGPKRDRLYRNHRRSSTLRPGPGSSDDLDAALAYHRERLGFAVDFAYESFDAAVSRDGVAIHLKCALPRRVPRVVPRTASDEDSDTARP